MRCFVRIAIGVTGEVFEGMPETLSPIGLFLMTENENDLSYGEVILIFFAAFCRFLSIAFRLAFYSWSHYTCGVRDNVITNHYNLKSAFKMHRSLSLGQKEGTTREACAYG